MVAENFPHDLIEDHYDGLWPAMTSRCLEIINLALCNSLRELTIGEQRYHGK